MPPTGARRTGGGPGPTRRRRWPRPGPGATPPDAGGLRGRCPGLQRWRAGGHQDSQGGEEVTWSWPLAAPSRCGRRFADLKLADRLVLHRHPYVRAGLHQQQDRIMVRVRRGELRWSPGRARGTCGPRRRPAAGPGPAPARWTARPGRSARPGGAAARWCRRRSARRRNRWGDRRDRAGRLPASPIAAIADPIAPISVGPDTSSAWAMIPSGWGLPVPRSRPRSRSRDSSRPGLRSTQLVMFTAASARISDGQREQPGDLRTRPRSAPCRSAPGSGPPEFFQPRIASGCHARKCELAGGWSWPWSGCSRTALPTTRALISAQLRGGEGSAP